MGRVRAVLFDVDGTLVDTDTVHLAVFRELLGPFGVDVTPQLFRDHVHGRGNSDICRTLLPDMGESEGEALFAHKEELFRSRLQEGEVVSFRGIIALLDLLARRGIRVGAVTNAPRANAELILEQAGLRERFPVLVIASECAAPKPSPAPYEAGMRALGACPGETIIVEDSPAGVRAAVAANAAAVIGIRSQLDAPSLLALGCTHTVRDFVEAVPLLEGVGALGEAEETGGAGVPPITHTHTPPSPAARDWVMGIDVGTTAVKVAVVDAAGGHRAGAESPTRAYVDANAPGGAADPALREQSLPAIWGAVVHAVLALPAAARRRVGRVGVCGAMHGVVLWCSETRGLLAGVGASRLVTWEDRRGCSGPGDTEWRRKLAAPPPGYGAATLAWMARERGRPAFRAFTACGTVGDWLTAGLVGCGARRGMCPTNAHSMGWCSLEGQWDVARCVLLPPTPPALSDPHPRRRFEAAGVPTSILPPVREPGSAVGFMTAGAAGALGLGTDPPPEVHLACGDSPASVFALLGGADSRALAISVGTSAQLSLPVRPEALTAALGLPAGSVDEAAGALRAAAPALELRPSLAGPSCGLLLVAASLNGGNTVAWLASCLARAARAVAARVPARETEGEGEEGAAAWEQAALQEVVASADVAWASAGGDLPHCRPTLFGERQGSEPAAWTGLHSSHGPGEVALALLEGLARQWATLFPPALARRCGASLQGGRGEGGEGLGSAVAP